MKKKVSIEKLSVVVCSKNEELRINRCLKSILINRPDEIIVVDGGSVDKTINVIRKFKVRLINSKNSNLSRDRQIGLDLAKNNFVAMIDCDHLLKKNQLNRMLTELKKNNFAIIQAQIDIKDLDFWTRAEKNCLDLVQNIPGVKKQMIGTAPNIYDKSKLKKIRFSGKITKTIDDTDYFYNASKKNIKFGVGKEKITSIHEKGFLKYVKKFLWYGKGDAEFCFKHKTRTLSMLYHLCVRYSVIYPLLSILNFKFSSAFFFIIQGLARFLSLVINLFKIYLKNLV